MFCGNIFEGLILLSLKDLDIFVSVWHMNPIRRIYRYIFDQEVCSVDMLIKHGLDNYTYCTCTRKSSP